MLIANERATRGSYPSELKSVMSISKAEESREWMSSWDRLNPGSTPLYDLSGLASSLGIAKLFLKDESVRSDLGSFKALGAPIALARLILRLWPDRNLDPKALFNGGYMSLLEDFTVISATDGNHGKGLAAAAQSIGCRCVIVLHANVDDEREQAIAQFGATVIRAHGNYDASVEEAARLAKANDWHVVSDTSYDGYEEIPRDVMQGYGTIAAEIVEALGSDQDAPFTHVFLQGGVGGLAAGIVSYFWEYYGARRPTVVIVEPLQADCLFQSALCGVASKATGSVDSVMAGLACGKTSPLAWRFLVSGADYFMTISDDDAIAAMRVLSIGNELDTPIVSGESGAAGLAGLLELGRRAEQATCVGLGPDARVLVISTEGATAPVAYQALVGQSDVQVLARQRSFSSKPAQATVVKRGQQHGVSD